MTPTKLSFKQQLLLIFLSLLIVGFGQPIWHWSVSLFAGTIGFALFFRTLLDIPSGKKRFWLATAWFSTIQLIQLFWMTSHPFAYIYAVYFLFAFLIGLQLGIMGLLLTPKLFEKWIPLLGFSSLWTLMEVVRLYFFSGYTWNPVGLALTGNLYSLQAASLVGVFGLSFWTMLVNLTVLRAWLMWPARFPAFFCLFLAILPILYGAVQLPNHQEKMANAPTFKALLVQSAFPAEEALEFKDFKEYASFIFDEWRQLLTITRRYLNKSAFDLIAFPEYVVPFGSYSFIYPYAKVKALFLEIYGPDAEDKLPKKETPLAQLVETHQGSIWAVNNAFFAQALANIFNSPLVIGLEDAEDVDGQRERYSSALYFTPYRAEAPFVADRYSKRVLVPMAEYIPFSFCRQLAAHYGVSGSFICGKEAGVYNAGKTPFGVSICYEETFGNLMRESRQQGAEVFVNLTSDVWFPDSMLPFQHLEHSRLRSVENGVPLLRACNTGITSAIDSAGQTVAILGNSRQTQEWSSDCLIGEVPLYSYSTLYTQFGDSIVIVISACLCLLWAGFSLLKIPPLF